MEVDTSLRSATQSPVNGTEVGASEKSKKIFWSGWSFSFFGKKVQVVDPAPGAKERATINTKNSGVFASLRKWFSSFGSGSSSEKTDNKARSWKFLDWFRKTPEAPKNPVMSESAIRAASNRQLDIIENQIVKERPKPLKPPPFSKTTQRVVDVYASAKPFHALASRSWDCLEKLEEDRTLSASEHVTVDQVNQTICAWKSDVTKALLSFTGTDHDYVDALPGVVTALQAAVDLLDPASVSSEPSQEGTPAPKQNPEQYQARITSLCTKLEELCAARGL